LPLIDGALRWYYEGEAYFLSRIQDNNSWRIVSYLDIAPGKHDFADQYRFE